jgi:flavoprotein
MAKNLGQMWYSRTPVLCHGSHDSGVFDRIKMTNVEEENKLAAWESKNAEKIRKMVQVLRCLKEKMVEVQVERVAVFCNKGEHCLRMYEVDETYPRRLPQDLREGWKKGQAGAEDPHRLEGVMEQLTI